MGILHLKRHLQPYASSVWIGTTNNTPDDNAKRITSVVIDGPSLVYHVYHCLLARMDGLFNPVDAQPSSDEVSIGVMRFLLHLRAVNVTIKRICFDGALPLVKRPTRLERLESSRQKLERLCLSKSGFSKSSTRRNAITIYDARTVFDRLNPTVMGREATPDPFMVATVAEDLKQRWNWRCIADNAPDAFDFLPGYYPDIYPWANMTEFETGEADIYTADAARSTDSSVLTGDSDFLLHDIGPRGSVIFLDSLETLQLQDTESLFMVRASELQQGVISEKFGITDLRRLGFELKYSPSTSISALVRRCKDNNLTEEGPSDLYRSFLKEYEGPGRRYAMRVIGTIPDPRISELCLQYEISDLRSDLEPPHIYLPFLIENCARRCAWTEGSWIRALAYSFLDAMFPGINSSQSVAEHTRRGSRICATTVELLDQEDTEAYIQYLLQTLEQTVPHDAKLIHWKTFALSEIWRPSETTNNPRLDRGDIRQFLEERCTGSQLDWNDIHLGAQVQAVLYSLKILQEMARAAMPTLKSGPFSQCLWTVNALTTLPPMHTLFGSRGSLEREIGPDGSVDSAVSTLSNLLSQYYQDDDATNKSRGISHRIRNFCEVRSRRGRTKKTTKPAGSGKREKREKSMNPYEILGDTS